MLAKINDYKVILNSNLIICSDLTLGSNLTLGSDLTLGLDLTLCSDLTLGSDITLVLDLTLRAVNCLRSGVERCVNSCESLVEFAPMREVEIGREIRMREGVVAREI